MNIRLDPHQHVQVLAHLLQARQHLLGNLRDVAPVLRRGLDQPPRHHQQLAIHHVAALHRLLNRGLVAHCKALFGLFAGQLLDQS